MESYQTLVSYNCGEHLSYSVMRLGGKDTYTNSVFELCMLLGGSCKITTGSEMFIAQAEDVFSIEAETPHSFEGTDCTMIVICLDQRFFERSLPDPRHPDFICNSALLGNRAAYDLLRKKIARLIKNNTENYPGAELRNWTLVYEIMDVMYNNFRVENSEVRNRHAHRYSARMAEISRIINENYQNELSLSSLADMVHLSAPYLSKFIEKQFGQTFLSYLNHIRLLHAVDELLKTNNTIESISANSGFPNSYAFVQAFKKEFGMLPSIYRRNTSDVPSAAQAPQRIEQHDYISILRKYLEPSDTEGSLPTISCRASFSAHADIAKLRHTWRDLTGVASAETLLTTDVQKLIRRIQKDIGFSYVKFNGIFSDEMHVYREDESGRPVMSFSYVDKVFDFLLSEGLRPMIQLGFMPQALSKENKRMLGYLVSEPKDISKWVAMVSSFIRHIEERYGKDEVRKWRFSLWHGPDTPSSMYGFSNGEAFRTLYKQTYDAVKGYDGELTFGIPSTFYIIKRGLDNWYAPFIEWCRQNNCLPDYLAFNFYDTTFTDDTVAAEGFGFSWPMTLGESPEGLNSFITQIRSERKKLSINSLPIYLTEWNNTPSQQDLLNDTCFKSCYIVKSILENYDRLDSFGYWTLTDWMGESALPDKLFFGGLGLFTANGSPKASYYALALLRQLGGTLLGKGEGWFATRSGDCYQVILYHYRHFSQFYAKGERFDMTFKDRYTPFAPEQPMDVHLLIHDLPDGEYMVTETTVSRNSGSAFDTWIAMGGVELRDLQENENLESRSVPAINKYTAKSSDCTLKLDALLDMLEVRLLRIEKI